LATSTATPTGWSATIRRKSISHIYRWLTVP